MLRLIDQQKYFLLHAPRQTGKTTCLLALLAHLNREGRYRAVYANLETAQTAREDVARGMRTICGALAGAARRTLGEERLSTWTAAAWAERGAGRRPDRSAGGLERTEPATAGAAAR